MKLAVAFSPSTPRDREAEREARTVDRRNAWECDFERCRVETGVVGEEGGDEGHSVGGESARSRDSVSIERVGKGRSEGPFIRLGVVVDSFT